MGYGGSLIWAAAIKEIKREEPQTRVAFLDSIPTPLEKITPKKIKNFHIYKKINQKLFWPRLKPDTIFYNNPKITPGTEVKNKKNFLVINRFDPKNNYVAKTTDEKMIFKKGHAISIICKNFGITAKEFQPEIYLTDEEIKKFNKHKEKLKKIITIEPNTKSDVTTNRNWRFDYWQEVVNHLRNKITVIQIGSPGSQLLSNVVDFRNYGSFREVAEVIRNSKLFLGTVGGLMHLSRAVNTKGIILYGGYEPVELTAYKDNINIYHGDNYFCGSKKTCLHCQEAMNKIKPEEVLDHINKLLI